MLGQNSHESGKENNVPPAAWQAGRCLKIISLLPPNLTMNALEMIGAR